MKDWPDWFVFLILCIIAFPVFYTERPEAHSDGVVRPALSVPARSDSAADIQPRASTRPVSTESKPTLKSWPASVEKKVRPAVQKAPVRPAAKPLAGARARLEREARRARAGAEKIVAEAKEALTYEVSSVVDGDTIRLANGKTVRLLQIDTPELYGRAECFGALASEATRRLLLDKRVTLVADPLLDDKDRYGRLLRYVYLDGQNVNLRLVAEGVAAPYFYRGEKGLFAWPLDRRAREAQAEGRGLWGHCPRAAYAPAYGVKTGPVYLAS